MQVSDIHAPTPQGPALRAQQTFLLGVDFHESAYRALAPDRTPAGRPVDAIVPAIVAYAFAAELYLKSLAGLGAGAGPTRGHHLPMLFGRLDGAVRIEIARRYQLRTDRDAAILADDLRAFGNVFKDWRYVYEGDGLHVRTNLLIACAQSLLDSVLSFQPDWSIDAWQATRLTGPPPQPSMTMMNLGGGTFMHLVGPGTEVEKTSKADADSQKRTCDLFNVSEEEGG